MHINTRIIPASEFLRTTATGELDFVDRERDPETGRSQRGA